MYKDVSSGGPRNKIQQAVRAWFEPVTAGLNASHGMTTKQKTISHVPRIANTYSFVGNLVGPVVNTTIEGGLERFISQPTGCGEQNMIKLAPNVYVLEYLMNTKQVTEANKENAYSFIQSGKLLNFM